MLSFFSFFIFPEVTENCWLAIKHLLEDCIWWGLHLMLVYCVLLVHLYFFHRMTRALMMMPVHNTVTVCCTELPYTSNTDSCKNPNEMNALLGHDSTLWSYTRPGIIWANVMNFGLNPRCRIDRSTCWPAVQCAITMPRLPPFSELTAHIVEQQQQNSLV